MSNDSVLILGGSGMLGAMTVDVFARAADVRLFATAKDRPTLERFSALYPKVEWRLLDAETADEATLAKLIEGSTWVVNCIGIIKPYIHDDNAAEIERSLKVNALFPQYLAKAAARLGAQVLQIATDCVYSGQKGAYDERALHDCIDVYGKTKSLGEPYLPGVHLLRCSIIGPEPKAFVSLLDWFLGQAQGAKVSGYLNHQWNGVTTYHFAKLCHAIIKEKLALPRLHHVIPSGAMAKADMLSCFARVYRRDDVTITPTEAKTVIDRTLSTLDAGLNSQLWKAAGYATPPTVAEMIEEMGPLLLPWREARK